MEHVDAAGAGKLLSDRRDVVVMDVRTPVEYASGHMPGATNVDFVAANFSTELAKLDRDKTYLVHCAAGGRSTRALAVFQQLGFKSVTHSRNKRSNWQGGPRVRGERRVFECTQGILKN